MPDGTILYIRKLSEGKFPLDSCGKKLARGVLGISQKIGALSEKLRLFKVKKYTPITFTPCHSITELKTLANKLGIKICVPKGVCDTDISILSNALESMIKIQNANMGHVRLPKFLILSDRLPCGAKAGALESFGLAINRSELFDNMDDIVFHELGHINHHTRTNIHKIGKTDELSRFGYKSDITDEFLNNMDLQSDIGYEISSYAKTSPAEFVAEIYRKLAQGEHISKKLLERYRMYNGPEIPKEVPFSGFF